MTAVREIPASDRRHRPMQQMATFLLVLLVLAGLRMWLTADEDIVARYASYDDLWFVRSAECGYWGVKDYTHLSAMRPPVYSLWLWAGMQLSIPQRVAIDGAYIGATLLLVYALRQVGMSRVWASVTFALVAFAPESFRLFRLIISDALNVPLMTALCALGLLVMTSRRYLLWGLPVGLVAGAFALNRGEGMLMASGMLACMAGLLFVRGVLQRDRIWLSAWRGARIVILPFFIMLAMIHAVKLANYRTFGVYATLELSAPGSTALMRALTRISPTRPVDYVTITRESLEMAYRASESFRELQPGLEGKVGQRWHEVTRLRRPSLPQGEILAGYTHWAIREAASNAGKYTSGRDADAFYAKAAAEINAAIDSGELAGRTVLSTYMDPDLGAWTPRMGNSLLAVWRCISRFGPELPVAMDAVEVTKPVGELFDRVCVRRSELQGHSEAAIAGKAMTQTSPPRDVRALNMDGTRTLALAKVTGRQKRLSSTQPAYSGSFVLEIPRGLENTVVRWRTTLDDKTVLRVNGPLRLGQQTLELPGDGPGACLQLGVEFRATDASGRLKVRRQLAAAYDYVIPAVVYAGLAVGALALLVLRRRSDGRWVCCVVLLTFAVAARLSMFAIIDACSWHGDQPRYVFPAVPAMLGCAMLLISGGGAAIAKTLRSRRVGAEPVMETAHG